MKTKQLYLGSVIGLVLIGVLSILINAGVFKNIQPVGTEICSVVKGVVGAEDISFIPGTNHAFISSYDRRVEVADPSLQIEGAIYLYNLDDASLIKVSPKMADFKPHGISIYNGENGEMRLFVVDHANGQHQIQIFEYSDSKLTLVRTVQSDQIISPNDVVAVGPNQFYVTNDHGFVDGIMRKLEDYLMLPFSNVIYFDGISTKEVESGINYSNGININQAGDQLYLASVTSLNLYVYDRDTETNELSLTNKINTGTGIDNIEVDVNGDLWLGAHPQLLKFVSHAKSELNRSPSEILKIKASDGSFDIETIYRSVGDPLSGSSVAAVKGNRMLVGGVFDPLMLDCSLGH